MSTVLIAGCGDVGTRLGLDLVAAGHAVVGIRRSATALPGGIHAVSADLTDAAGLAAALAPIGAVDAVAYTAAASGRTEEAYRDAYVTGLATTLQVLAERGDPIGRVAFTASTAVYGQDDGSWVDEDSPTRPDRFSGRVLLDAEAVLAASPWPSTSLRVAGIYGPGRERLLDRVRNGDEVCVEGRANWTNRVHRDDVAGALAHVLGHGAAPIGDLAPHYVVVDDEPADRCDVVTWLASRLGVAAPRTVGPDDHEPSSRGGNKRCSNALLRSTGWTPRFPSYREGYASLLGASDPGGSNANVKGT